MSRYSISLESKIADNIAPEYIYDILGAVMVAWLHKHNFDADNTAGHDAFYKAVMVMKDDGDGSRPYYVSARELLQKGVFP